MSINNRSDSETACSAHVHLSGEQEFLERQILSSACMREHARLFRQYFNSPLSREEVAARENIPLGQLLRIFNETAPLEAPIYYRFRNVRFVLRAMHGLCDDFYGERFGKFGEPLTLRFYLTPEANLPPELFTLADWNFMDAGFPYFVAYAYGSWYENMLVFSGLQSDVAQRYTFLFLARGEGTEVRTGQINVFRQTYDLSARLSQFVPLFRRVFQRHWIESVLAGILFYAIRAGNITKIAFQQFQLSKEENAPGHIVHRIYNGLAKKIPGHKLMVTTERSEYRYHCVEVADLATYLQQKYSLPPTCENNNSTQVESNSMGLIM